MLDDWGLCVARGGTAGGSRRKREGPRYAGGRRSGRELPAEPIPCYRRQTYSPSAFEGFVKKNRIQRERGKRAGGKNRAEVYASTNNYSILQFSSSSAITARVIRCHKSRPRNFLLRFASDIVERCKLEFKKNLSICAIVRRSENSAFPTLLRSSFTFNCTFVFLLLARIAFLPLFSPLPPSFSFSVCYSVVYSFSLRARAINV